jgi:esterase/lipase superfamily enzyme
MIWEKTDGGSYWPKATGGHNTDDSFELVLKINNFLEPGRCQSFVQREIGSRSFYGHNQKSKTFGNKTAFP